MLFLQARAALPPHLSLQRREGKQLAAGFGASVYHWRYNLLELAKAGHRVFALDMLGFGGSGAPARSAFAAHQLGHAGR